MKRFYKKVSWQEMPDGARILLDGKPVLTPLKAPMNAVNPKIAEAVTKEWEGQTDDIDPNAMPLTQILTTAQDYVSLNRKDIEDLLLRYLDSDLVCYHCETPPELAAHQEQHWSPWMTWLKDQMGIELCVQRALSVAPVKQTDRAILQDYMAELDLYGFTVFQMLVAASGSVVLAIAFMRGEITPEKMLGLVRLEENFYVDHHDLAKHGPDPSQEKQDRVLIKDLIGARTFLDLYYDHD